MANGCPGCEPHGPYSLHSSSNHQDGTEVADRAGSPETGRSSPNAIYNPFYTGRPRTPVTCGPRSGTLDRQEIIRRIKSGESRPTSPELDRPSSRGLSRKRKSPVPFAGSDVLENRPSSPEVVQDNHSAGIQIERPRSALHRGDFREKGQTESAFERFGTPQRNVDPVPPLSTSPIVPWHPAFPSIALRQIREDRQSLQQDEVVHHIPRPSRSRAASNASFASSFAYKPPTSPLAQSSRPDTPEPPLHRSSRSPERSRRHTFSPQSLKAFQSALEYPTSARHIGAKHAPSLRAERTFPYQAHQPRRSLNFTSSQSVPQAPLAASRRTSLSDSPLHLAPMVGSYEESILRGRMSTSPSKPLNFVAQIGVLGKGDCKASLRCPSHVSIPFPAVFYSYGAGSRLVPANDQPSPYVGLIDMENNLLSAGATDGRRRRLQTALNSDDSRASSRTRENADQQTQRRRRQKQQRRSGSPRAPPGGSYRIPQQGQLQIVIKNPNKTAVKLFLVPYDLSDMEPGQKTFIRQRSYSAGPTIDIPLSHRRNLGTDRPEAALSTSDDPNDRPVLRYLIHLNMCCPSRGRFFLYKSIRVVFANRVPDGKEKLCNEIQLPEPRYSTYKAGRDSLAAVSNSALVRENGRAPGSSGTGGSDIADSAWRTPSKHMAQSLPGMEYNRRSDVPMQTLPYNFTTLSTLESRPASRQMSDGMELDSERSQDTQSTQSPLSSPMSLTAPAKAFPRLEESFVFERDRSRERKPEQRNESLLSKRLMDLAFQG